MCRVPNSHIIHGLRNHWLHSQQYSYLTKDFLVPGFRSALLFLVQSIVVGLAVAFVVLLVRPDLLSFVDRSGTGQRVSYADAVQKSSAAVANVYTERLVEDTAIDGDRPRFRVNTSFASRCGH